MVILAGLAGRGGSEDLWTVFAGISLGLALVALAYWLKSRR